MQLTKRLSDTSDTYNIQYNIQYPLDFYINNLFQASLFMRGEKSSKASLCCSVSHLSIGTVIAIYNTEAESELRCGDQLMGEVRVEPGLTSVWASPQTQTGNPSRVKLSENILNNIRHNNKQQISGTFWNSPRSPWMPWEDRHRTGRSLSHLCPPGWNRLH